MGVEDDAGNEQTGQHPAGRPATQAAPSLLDLAVARHYGAIEHTDQD